MLLAPNLLLGQAKPEVALVQVALSATACCRGRGSYGLSNPSVHV
jgi:hypothetical protein